MNIEEQIRDALSREPQSPPNFDEGWNEFARRARRATIVRTIAIATSVAVVAAALAIAVPRLTNSSAPNFVSPQPGESRLSPRNGDPLVGYTIQLADGWRFSAAGPGEPAGITRSREPVPFGHAGSVDGTKTVWLSIAPEQPREFNETVRYHEAQFERNVQNGARMHKREIKLAGRRAVRFDLSIPAQTDGHSFQDVCVTSCEESDYFIDWPNRWVLRLQLVSGKQAPGSEVDIGRRIAESIRFEQSDGEKPHGSFAAAIEMDPIARGVQRFLEARIAGKGAEAFVRGSAVNGYHHGGSGPPRLYESKWTEISCSAVKLPAEAAPSSRRSTVRTARSARFEPTPTNSEAKPMASMSRTRGSLSRCRRSPARSASTILAERRWPRKLQASAPA